ncbi:MAG: hypothetical protein ABW321_35195 [Polyangiales bacterium]
MLHHPCSPQRRIVSALAAVLVLGMPFGGCVSLKPGSDRAADAGRTDASDDASAGESGGGDGDSGSGGAANGGIGGAPRAGSGGTGGSPRAGTGGGP